MPHELKIGFKHFFSYDFLQSAEPDKFLIFKTGGIYQPARIMGVKFNKGVLYA